MTRRSTLVTMATALAALAAGGACQSQRLSIGDGNPLERGDVESLPIGDANGDDASGGYLFTDFEITGCHCREGSELRFGCSQPWTIGADGLWLQQVDGALQVNAIQANQVDERLALQGGIDADGRFEVGGVSDVVDLRMTLGQAFNFASGSVTARDAVVARWSTRAQYIDNDASFDCDLVADVELVWWPPDAQGECAWNSQCHPEAPYCVGGTCSVGATGDACVFDDDCAGGRCAEGRCSDGGVGAPCLFASDCQSEVCGADGLCADVGTCGGSESCAAGMLCYDGACQAGAEGDGCETPLHCNVEHSCVAGQCWDGSEGDPCTSPVDCQIDSRNCVQEVCYDGSAGDPCEVATECDIAGGLSCGADGVCQ